MIRPNSLNSWWKTISQTTSIISNFISSRQLYKISHRSINQWFFRHNNKTLVVNSQLKGCIGCTLPKPSTPVAWLPMNMETKLVNDSPPLLSACKMTRVNKVDLRKSHISGAKQKWEVLYLKTSALETKMPTVTTQMMTKTADKAP